MRRDQPDWSPEEPQIQRALCKDRSSV